MQLSPRYDGPPVIDIDAFVDDPAAAVIRQRERLLGTLSSLSSHQWATPSRCEGWSAQDVAEHLVSVNRFWVFAIGSAVRGEPTRLLESFDPVTVPAALVEQARGATPAETVEKLAATTTELSAVLRTLSGRDWDMPAEAPPGHVALRAVGAHALWDAWIHERDVLVPLGGDQPIEADEVTTSLAYAAALAPAISLNAGQAPRGSLAVRARHPDVAFTVEVGRQVRVVPGAAPGATAAIEDDAVSLLDALSGRAELPPVADRQRWLVDGLQRAFDRDG